MESSLSADMTSWEQWRSGGNPVEGSTRIRRSADQQGVHTLLISTAKACFIAVVANPILQIFAIFL